MKNGDKVLVTTILVKKGPREYAADMAGRGPYNLVRAMWRPDDPSFAYEGDIGHMCAGMIPEMQLDPGVPIADLEREIKALWDDREAVSYTGNETAIQLARRLRAAREGKDSYEGKKVWVPGKIGDPQCHQTGKLAVHVSGDRGVYRFFSPDDIRPREDKR